MNHLDNIPGGIRSLLKMFNKTSILESFSEKRFDEYYQERCENIEKDVKVLLPESEIRRLMQNDSMEKIVIRVFKGEKEGYKIMGTRAYAQIERPHNWYTAFLPKMFDRWTVDEDTGEFVKLDKIPTRDEFNCKVCGMCGDVICLSSGEMEIEEFFYVL